MSTPINAGDIVLTTLGEALTLVRHKQTLAQRNLDASTIKVVALEKAVADYNAQLILNISEEMPKKKR